MAQSITLQTSDSDIISGDILGRLSFAASSETSGSDALLIGGGIYAEAEDTFTQITNATSLVFSTASSETAIGKLKITSSGYFLPLLNNTYDIGSSSFVFRNLYVNSGIFTNLSVNGTGVSISGHTHSSSAITDFVTEAAKYGPVVSVAGRTGTVTISSSDVSGLPTAGTGSTNYCAGNDSRLSDSRTALAHASSHATGGSDEITPANIGAAVQADLLNLLTLQTTTIDVLPRLWATGSPTLTSGSLILCFFTPLVTRTISQITMYTGGTTAASGLTLARMALYIYNDTTATGTLVAATANDTTLFIATNTGYTRSLSTGGGLPSTYTLTAGVRYAFGLLCVGTTMPQIISQASNGGFIYALVPRLSGQRTSQTDLPTSLTSVSTAGSVPYARLS